MILFYAADLTETAATLAEDEFQHCCKVLRHKMGDRIHLTNGQGLIAEGELVEVKKQMAQVKVLSSKQIAPSTQSTHLYVCPPKNRSRWEWLIEKSVELGVDSITPLITYHTERGKINETRTQKILRSAALQCTRPYHPTLHPPMKWAQLLKLPQLARHDKYLAHYLDTNPNLIDQKINATSASILVGPEGDFSKQETEEATAFGFQLVNISKNRLRTETAAIAVVNILKQMGY